MIEPSQLYIRNGVYYFDITVKGRRIRRSTRRKTLEGALIYARRLLKATGLRADHGSKVQPREIGADWAATVDAGMKRNDSWLRLMRQRCKDRAKLKGIRFTLTVDETAMMALNSDGKCAVTGIPFSWDKPECATMPPFGPSIDRIDPMQGYVAKNCRLVCQSVNMAMSNWGEDVLYRIADALNASRHKGKE